MASLGNNHARNAKVPPVFPIRTLLPLLDLQFPLTNLLEGGKIQVLFRSYWHCTPYSAFEGPAEALFSLQLLSVLQPSTHILFNNLSLLYTEYFNKLFSERRDCITQSIIHSNINTIKV